MLPLLNSTRIVQHVTQQFGGYDARESTGADGAVAMTNMSSDNYPYITTRQPRYSIETGTDTYKAFASYDKLLYVKGTTGSWAFYYDKVSKGAVSSAQKFFCQMGADTLIFPDKKYYHPGETPDVIMDMRYYWGIGFDPIVFSDGTLYGVSATANCIKAGPGRTFNEDTRYVVAVGDALTISACTDLPANNKTAVVREIKSDYTELYFDENTWETGSETSATFLIYRNVPLGSLAFECNNRIWMCNYDTIYACALGDFKNWYKFEGLSTDSYSVSVGSPGDFTACCAYMGYPMFFKEDSIFKIYGTKPSNYEAMRTATLGVADGSHLSLAIAGETLYYLSRAGVMAYNGGVPVNISAPLGDVRWKNGVAGSDGIKYYISMQNESDEWNLFVYDTRYKTWHRESATQAVGFAWLDNMYMCNLTSYSVIGNSDPPTGSTAETSIPWLYETGDIFENDVNKKDVKKILLRCTLETGATLKIEIKYDGGSYVTVKELTAGVKQSYYIPLIPRRCDYYRLKFSGVGSVTLHSLTRETGHGSANKL